MVTYLISDFHFGDKWIQSCRRDFDTVEQMNTHLKSRCLAVVDESDELVFLGDIIGKNGDENEAWTWWGELPIDIWVAGNHDPFERSEFSDLPLPLHAEYSFAANGFEFHCCHKPSQLPDDYEGWGIYGHKHNENPEEYPFLDQESSRINLSASMINYEPVSIDEIISYIETEESYTTRLDTG
ncbi:metallophosphoesterase [Haloglomus litoreum]|uniref:metallophosphoesterase n=1 Tax=Haloglomus litoreum TaxID=3034026 RepID=UPI0023E854E4|nr:metallophosphoesterase [Haloglomus sp. DT116]